MQTINSKSISLQLIYKDEEHLAHILNHTKWGRGYVQIYTSYYTTFHPHGTNEGCIFHESKVVHNVQQLHVWSKLFTVDYLTLPMQHGRIYCTAGKINTMHT